MECPFVAGDEVVYVGAKQDLGDPYRGLRKNSGLLVLGAVYTVAAVIEHPLLSDDLGVVLREVRAARPDGAFTFRAFRKVQKPKTTLSIETFLTIKPGFEEPKRTTPARKREKA